MALMRRIPLLAAPLILGAYIILPSHTMRAQDTLKGLVFAGDPTSMNGAAWTYQDTVAGVGYNLAGILFKPAGSGPFPGIILNHGGGDNVSGLPTTFGRIMVRWGLVCIGVNLTHSSGVPIGAPGTSSQKGASNQNILRARKCWEILAGLGYVDTTRIGAHGFSYGAYLNAALLGAYPTKFRVASHAGGGIGTSSTSSKAAQVSTIIAPYQIHHGTNDTSIPFSADQQFDSLLTLHGVPHQFCVYPGYDHLPLMQDPTMLQRMKEWYNLNGLIDTLALGIPRKAPGGQPASFILEENYPNPFNPSTVIEFELLKAGHATVQVFDVLGRLSSTLVDRVVSPGRHRVRFDAASLPSGVYFCRLATNQGRVTNRMMLMK